MNHLFPIRVLAVLGVLAVLHPTAPAQGEPASAPPGRLQLLANPSFTGGLNERGHPDAWWPAMLPARSTNLQWGIEKTDGRDVLFIRQEAAGAGVFNHWAQSVIAPPAGSAITIEADVKGEALAGAGGAVLLVFRDGGGREIGMLTNLSAVAPMTVRGDADWTVIRLHGVVPESCLRMDARVGLAPDAAGALHVRSVRLYHERGGARPADDATVMDSTTDSQPLVETPLGTPISRLADEMTPTPATEPSPSPPAPSAPANTTAPSSPSPSPIPPAPPPADATQLLKNPDFREADAAGAPAAWFCTILKSFSSGARSGLAADADWPYLYLMQNSAGEGVFNNWAQRVESPPAAESLLQLRAMVATRDAKPGAVVKMEFINATGNLIAAHTSEGAYDLSGTRPWQTVILEAPVPAGCARVIVRAGLAPLPGSGALYLRHVELFVK